MKFLKLAVTDAYGNRAEYSLTELNAELDREKLLSHIGDALFGNVSIFSGATELTVDFENEEYILKRSFDSDQEFRLYLSGKSVPMPKAQEIIDKIAGLSDKKWRLNAAPVDIEEFSADPGRYAEKYLASLGFDREELEKKIEEKENSRDFALGQAEAIKALSEDFTDESDSIREEFEKADKLLANAIESSEKYALEIARVEEKKQAEAELAELKQSESKIDSLIADLEENEDNKETVTAFEALQELNKDFEQADTELKALSAEIAEAEVKIAELSKKIEENDAEIEEYAETVKGLSSDFSNIITENAEKGELTAAALDKATDGEFDKFTEELAELENQNKKYAETALKLSKTRVDSETRSLVRTGMALETSIIEKQERLDSLKKLLDDRRKYLEELETELADSQSLFENKDAARINRADEKRMKLLRYKILCHTLQVDISSAEQKIRANVETKQSYAEDITALTRAKVSINDYVDKLQARNAKLADKLISLKARLSFCKDVDELEIGALCPICNGRITDKAELSKENDRLSASYEKYSAEQTKNRSILAEYSTKLEKIDTRLGQLKERDALCNSYVDSLSVTVGAKQTALTGILKEADANSVPTLEKSFDAATAEFFRMSNAGIDGAFLQEHIKFLEKEIKRIKTYVSDLSAEVVALERDISDTEEVYTATVAAHLDGHKAYEMLDELATNERNEDSAYIELAEISKNRDAHLEYVLKTEKSAAEFIVAATDVLSEAVAEIKQVQSALDTVAEENRALTAELETEKANLEIKSARVKELKDATERITAAQNELYSGTDVAGIDEAAALALKIKLLTEEQIATATKEIDAYNSAKTALEEKIATLSKAINANPNELQSPKEAKEAYDAALNALLEASERQSLRKAVQNATNVKISLADRYAEQAKTLKAIAGGKAAEIILPVINDVLSLTGGDCRAICDESNGLTFTKEGGAPIGNVNADRLTVAATAALNRVLTAVTGMETVKFATVDKLEELEAAASKYGILFI